MFEGTESLTVTNTHSRSALCWLVCQSTPAGFTPPAQIWWACSHLFMRSQPDLNGRHNKQSHIWAGSWNPACVDTPISAEASARAHLTQIWLSRRCPNSSNTWGWSHMELNVCRAQSCVQTMIHRREGGREGGREGTKEGRKIDTRMERRKAGWKKCNEKGWQEGWATGRKVGRKAACEEWRAEGIKEGKTRGREWKLDR